MSSTFTAAIRCQCTGSWVASRLHGARDAALAAAPAHGSTPLPIPSHD